MSDSGRYSIPFPSECRVPLSGDFDIVTADQLVRDLLSAGPFAPVVVADLRDVSFMDSSGLRGLLAVRQTLAADGGELRLANVPRQVQTLLDVTGAGVLFGYCD